MRSFCAFSSTETSDSDMRRSAVTALALLGSIACSSSGPSPSPLANLGEVTSARVRVSGSGATKSMVVTDSKILADLQTLAAASGDWHRPWDTTPTSQISAMLYRDTVYLGVVFVGRNFVSVGGQVRPIAPSEAAQVARLRALK